MSAIFQLQNILNFCVVTLIFVDSNLFWTLATFWDSTVPNHNPVYGKLLKYFNFILMDAKLFLQPHFRFEWLLITSHVLKDTYYVLRILGWFRACFIYWSWPYNQATVIEIIFQINHLQYFKLKHFSIKSLVILFSENVFKIISYLTYWWVDSDSGIILNRKNHLQFYYLTYWCSCRWKCFLNKW